MFEMSPKFTSIILTGIIGHHKHFNKIAEEVKVAIMDELRTSHSQFLAIAL